MSSISIGNYVKVSVRESIAHSFFVFVICVGWLLARPRVTELKLGGKSCTSVSVVRCSVGQSQRCLERNHWPRTIGSEVVGSLGAALNQSESESEHSHPTASLFEKFGFSLPSKSIHACIQDCLARENFRRFQRICSRFNHLVRSNESNTVKSTVQLYCTDCTTRGLAC